MRITCLLIEYDNKHYNDHRKERNWLLNPHELIESEGKKYWSVLEKHVEGEGYYSTVQDARKATLHHNLPYIIRDKYLDWHDFDEEEYRRACNENSLHHN